MTSIKLKAKNLTQTAVTNIIEQRMLLILKCISNLTFRMLRQTSCYVFNEAEMAKKETCL